jgi:dihydrofolate reductase
MAAKQETVTRKIVVHIATSADGYIARSDGSLDWLTERRAPKGFYGLPEFTRSVDAKILGRKTDISRRMGEVRRRRQALRLFPSPPPEAAPAGVEFVTGSIRDFATRLRRGGGKNVWMMGGGEIIGSFLDEGAIDEFVVTVMPVFIGDGVPLIGSAIGRCLCGCARRSPFPTGPCRITTTWELSNALAQLGEEVLHEVDLPRRVVAREHRHHQQPLAVGRDGVVVSNACA